MIIKEIDKTPEVNYNRMVPQKYDATVKLGLTNKAVLRGSVIHSRIN